MPDACLLAMLDAHGWTLAGDVTWPEDEDGDRPAVDTPAPGRRASATLPQTALLLDATGPDGGDGA